MWSISTNCTLPPNGATFVQSPNVRGTLDIVWSCVSLLLICTWSILHLNVPIQSTPRNKKQSYNRTTRRLARKFGWMAMNVMSPEWAMGKAWSDYRTVSDNMATFKCIAEQDDVPWSQAHSHLANMGGFVLKFSETTPLVPHHRVWKFAGTGIPPTNVLNPRSKISQAATELTVNSANPHRNSLPARIIKKLNSPKGPDYLRATSMTAMSRKIGTIDWHKEKLNSVAVDKAIETVTLNDFQGSYEKKSFLSQYDEWFCNLRTFRGNIWVLDSNQVLLARQLGIIKRLPNVSEDEISDRNKGDLFVKIIALCQILWFSFQFGVRVRLNLSTSLLEVLTLASTVSTFFIYLLLLKKPKDVECSIGILATRYASPKEMIRLALVGPKPYNYRSSPWIPNSARHWSRNTTAHPLMGATFGAVVFGGLHYVAWYWHSSFPSEFDKWAWNIASAVAMAAVPTVYLVQALITSITRLCSYKTNILLRSGFERGARYSFSYLIWAVFFLSRLCVLVLAFRSLAFLNPETFQKTLSDNIPHMH